MSGCGKNSFDVVVELLCRGDKQRILDLCRPPGNRYRIPRRIHRYPSLFPKSSMRSLGLRSLNPVNNNNVFRGAVAATVHLRNQFDLFHLLILSGKT
jgi:hypothetical protein